MKYDVHMPNLTDNRASVAFVVVQRDEGELLRAWTLHHMGLTPECIVIVDDGSTDEHTVAVLGEVAAYDSVHVIYVEENHFDQETCVDLGIREIQKFSPSVRWLFSLDVDEFLDIRPTLSGVVSILDAQGIVYASAAHLNALPVLQAREGARVPWYLGTPQYYRPWIERPWQEEGHLRKAFCRMHENIRFAVGNHYVFHDRLLREFPGAPFSPACLAPDLVCLRHFELRDGGAHLLRKLANLAQRQIVPGADPDAPWWERNRRLDQLYHSYADRPEDLYAELVVRGPRSLWGTEVPVARLLMMEPL